MPEEIPQQPVPIPAAKKAGLNWLYVLIGLIVAGLLIAAGVWAYYYYQPKKEEAKSEEKVEKVASASAKKQELKSFSGTLYDSMFDTSAAADTQPATAHTYSFQYPTNWTLVENNALNKNNGHYITLTSSNGAVIKLFETPGGIGGACEDTTPPDDMNVASEAITVNSQALFLTATGNKAAAKIQKVYLDSDSNYYCVEIASLKSAGDSINFNFEMSVPAEVAKDTFLASDDYKDTKAILTSLKVTN